MQIDIRQQRKQTNIHTAKTCGRRVSTSVFVFVLVCFCVCVCVCACVSCAALRYLKVFVERHAFAYTPSALSLSGRPTHNTHTGQQKREKLFLQSNGASVSVLFPSRSPHTQTHTHIYRLYG